MARDTQGCPEMPGDDQGCPAMPRAGDAQANKQTHNTHY